MRVIRTDTHTHTDRHTHADKRTLRDFDITAIIAKLSLDFASTCVAY